MIVANSPAVDAALETYLAADAELMALLPDGVWWRVAPADKKRFLLLSLADHADAYVMPYGVAWERFVYLVKAVTEGKSGLVAAQAEARIHLLLQDQTLTAPGYHPSMVIQRTERLPPGPEVDEVTDARWHHRGGQYELLITPSP